VTAFTVTTAKNIDELASKTGGDTYAINGGTLTIDQDSRYGTNQSTSSTLGTVTISSALGGKLKIDATAVRIIPYNTGSGNVPASNTVITQSGVTGKLIGVWSAINVAPTAAGSAMPASGWIKVKQVVGSYAAGALTGITATATGADKVGWIEVVGDESSACVVPRLGQFLADGALFEVGTTTGTNTDTYQLPTNGSIQYFGGVWVNTGPADANEFYPCAGSLVAAGSVATDAVRGKVCWISTAGVLRFGHDGTNAGTGYTPTAGKTIVIGNILLNNCTTAARTVNAVPNTTLSTRYDFSASGGGDIILNKVCCAWYLGFTLALKVDLNYVATLEQINLARILAPITWNQVGIGQSAALTQVPLVITQCSSGGALTDCTFARANQNSNWNIGDISDAIGFAFTRLRAFSLISRNNQSMLNMLFNRCADFVIDDYTWGQSTARFTSCSNFTCSNFHYYDDIKGLTLNTNLVSALSLGTFVFDFELDGFDFCGLTNCHPQHWAIGISDAFCRNITIRNIATPEAPLSLGTVNACKGIVFVYYSTQNVKLSRIYTTGSSQGGLINGDSTDDGLVIQNVALGYTVAPAFTARNILIKGLVASDVSMNGAGMNGSIFADYFNSATTGRIQFFANEPSSVNAAYVTLTNGAAFSGSANGLSMPTIGMSVTWETPHYVIGHTGLSSITVPGAANFLAEFSIDKNDGAGWSSWAEASTGNLTTVTGIDAATGFKLRIRITTTVTNATALNLVKVNTTSTTTTQAYQYPLDVATLALTGIPPGTEIHAYLGTNPDTAVEIAGVESATSETFSFQHTVGGSAGYITFIKRGLKPFKLPLTYATEDVSIPVFIGADLGYNNPA